jgi:uncharacterized 2Fe-2S/4Fe-4S cluster protein (DUF4445 family)
MASLDPGGLDPLVRKLLLKADVPSLDDTASDWERLQRVLRPRFPDHPFHIGLGALQELGPALRQGDWQVTVTLAEKERALSVIRVEAGDTTNRAFGLAVDVGTTTVSVELLDLSSGASLGSHLEYNGQIPYGTDVTSRMLHAEKRKDGLAQLREAVLKTLNEMIAGLAAEHGVRPDEIAAVVVAGNTIMVHLLLGVDPTSIRKEPYVPGATVFPFLSAREVGLAVYEAAMVYLLPAVSGYVGGDITAGLLATGIADEQALSILIDIGTNGETVLGNREWLVACSGSAGSAFEGCGLEWGMHATDGAIERVWVEDGHIGYQTVSGEKPRGVCGSGLIDALGSFLLDGIIDRSARIRLGAPGTRRGEAYPEVVLAPAAEAAMGRDIVLTQANIDNLLRDKAALYAGSRILLSNVGLEFDLVERVLIAGNFGQSLNIERAVLIGLLPDIPRERIRFIGNSSLAGARRALLSQRAWRRAAEIATSITGMELTAEPRYFDEYTGALFLPHTNIDLFPSVKGSLSS